MLRFFLAALALPAILAAQTSHKLIVISIDGLDARFLSEPSLRVKAPNIRRLMREGASAALVGVAPAATWPAHASLVTGVSPWQHGVLADDLPASSMKTVAIWDAAARQGLRTATVYWPGSLGANVAWNLPELQETRRGAAVQLDAIAQKSVPPDLVPRIEKMFPAFGRELWSDLSATQAATWLLSIEKPDLLFVHFAELDAEEHETGALSLYSREVLETNDEQIGQILAKMLPGTVVAIVSDHGMGNANRVVRPRVLLRQAGIAAKVEIADGLIGALDDASAAGLRKLAGEGRKSGIAREVPLAEVRARAPGHPRWVAAFDTLPDFVASGEDRGAAVGSGNHLGTHVIWPGRPGFRSILILAGPGIRPLKLGEIDLLQVAPTLADAVNVRLPAAKATSLWRQIAR